MGYDSEHAAEAVTKLVAKITAVALALLAVASLGAACAISPPTSRPSSTSAPAFTPSPAPTSSPTATHIPGRDYLYETIDPPLHMANFWWRWDEVHEFRELVVEFSIHADPGNFSNEGGLYLMASDGNISGQGYYFGLQTSVLRPSLGRGAGKGIIFSKWEERDLSFARIADPVIGWKQSAGYEGDFIGVRLSYDWGVGEYKMRLAPESLDKDGEWYGVWITDLATNITTWAGSLKFALVDGRTYIQPSSYSTLEIYGAPIRPIDIPAFHVTMGPPIGDELLPDWGSSSYGLGEFNPTTNANARYDSAEDVLELRVGGLTEQIEPPVTTYFE